MRCTTKGGYIERQRRGQTSNRQKQERGWHVNGYSTTKVTVSFSFLWRTSWTSVSLSLRLIPEVVMGLFAAMLIGVAQHTDCG